MLRIRVARNSADVDLLRSAWESTQRGQGSLFQSFGWNRLAARLFADREEPYFIFCENDNGLAIIPAVIRLESQTISLAGEMLFDYRDFLACGDCGALGRAWQELVSLDLPLAVTAIYRPDVSIWNQLPKQLFSRAPRLTSSEISAEAFALNHARAFSRLRKLQRMGLEIRQYSGADANVRRIYDLRSRQSIPGELFHDRRRVDFMVAVCTEEGSRCEVFTLEHGGTLAAALITFRDADFRRFYTTYYDRNWARYSPGVSLLFEIARRSLAEDLSFDLMTGEQHYKLRIAQRVQELYEVRASALQVKDVSPGIRVAEHAA
ncbi:MAG TPA: GNAT family N-acetyltransferase [Candidatus Sulfotelmatobacter sp.]|nr:GNAT family N-acetyltransferase [Candidatus Sulfotelmatobacter sp.]